MVAIVVRLRNFHPIINQPMSSEVNRRILLLKNKTTPRDPYHDVFTDAGFEPTFIPLLKHGHVDREKSIEYFTGEEFLLIPVFIITSQRAVECLNECLEHVSLEIKTVIHEKTVYTVGPATTEVLREAGFTNIKGGSDAGNGSVLSDIIIKDVQEGGPSKMIFLTGEIRKDIIPRKLKQAKIDLIEKVIYKTEPRDDIVSNFHSSSKDVRWVVFFSPQGTVPIVEHLQGAERSSAMGPFVASIGPTTEEYLQSYSIGIDAVASKPEAKSLLAAITAYEHQN